jgi:hypothetical protein
MRPLSYARVEDVDAAVALVSADPQAPFSPAERPKSIWYGSE